MRLGSADDSNVPSKGPGVSAQRREIPSLAGFWLRGVLGAAAILLLAFAVVLFAWVENEEVNSLRELKSRSELLVRELHSRVVLLQERLREWGADPQLRALLRGEDTDELRAGEEWLVRTIPGAQRVLLVKPGFVGAEQDPRSKSLSYAGLDLIDQAERQRRVTLLEVHRLGSPEEHLAIAAPVLDEDGSVLGVLYVSLPISRLPSLTDAGGERGRILFQQRVGDQVATVAPAIGDAEPPGSLEHQAPVPGTRLRAVVWVTDGETLDAEMLLIAGIGYLVLLALIALALWLPLRSAKQALVSDYAGVVALVEDVVSNKPLRRLHCRLAETGPVIKVLTGLLRGLKTAPRGRAPQAPGHRSCDAERAAAGPGVTAEKQPVAGSEAMSEDTTYNPPGTEHALAPESVPVEIFRAYDIRGIVDVDLTAELMRVLGLAVGTQAIEAGDQTVIVGRDTRRSGVELTDSLVSGLRASGCDVLDLGVVPTPLVYFATRYRGETSGAMVTASHNPENYNGLKVVIGGSSLAGDQIAALRERVLSGSFARGDGRYQVGDLVTDYVDQVEKDVTIARALKIVIDCGNATASVVAPRLFRALGCELVEVNCNPDAGFPEGRVPDPTRPECLEALQQVVVAQGADLGLAFDGDGDRLGVVDSSGKVIWPDRVLMLLAADVLSRHPGTDVIFDVKSSHHLATEILRHGGRPVMWKSGHSPLKTKLRETGALLAGEWTGHIIFQERWFGFDDALYSGARLLEVLALDPRPSGEIFAGLPEAVGTPELFLHLAEGESERIMQAVLAQVVQLTGLDLYTEDGLRAETPHGWGLVRASNTQPAVVFRFEADDEEELSKIQDLFRGIMARAAPDLPLPF
jgi:phosphomannomutase/phosphoglucomutase